MKVFEISVFHAARQSEMKRVGGRFKRKHEEIVDEINTILGLKDQVVFNSNGTTAQGECEIELPKDYSATQGDRDFFIGMAEKAVRKTLSKYAPTVHVRLRSVTKPTAAHLAMGDPYRCTFNIRGVGDEAR